MNYGLFIHDACMHGETLVSAFRFARPLLARGHNIRQVFFYGDAAWILNQPRNSGCVALDGLAKLSLQHSFPMLACQAAAERLGVVAHPEAVVQLGSLGQWFDALYEMDRIVSFSA